MFGFIMAIIALVAAGCIVAYAVVLTIKWLRNKVKEKLAKKNVEKVVLGDLQALIDECNNPATLDELDKLADKGYTHVMADVGYDGKIVGDVELVQNQNNTLDREVEELINRTNQGMVIIS